MVRITLLQLVLFSTPFILFFLYRGFILRHRRAEGAAFDPAPYHLLFIAGGVLVFASLIFMALSQEKQRNVDYVPAHLENGKVVSGKFIPSDGHDGDVKENRNTNEQTDPP